MRNQDLKIGQMVEMRGGFSCEIITLYPATTDRPWVRARVQYIATGNRETVPAASLTAQH